jgi:hypothetical protein
MSQQPPNFWHQATTRYKTAVPQVEAVAVYLDNNDQDLVIRQRNSTGEDDPMVVVPRQYAPALIEALKAALTEKK